MQAQRLLMGVAETVILMVHRSGLIGLAAEVGPSHSV